MSKIIKILYVASSFVLLFLIKQTFPILSLSNGWFLVSLAYTPWRNDLVLGGDSTMVWGQTPPFTYVYSKTIGVCFFPVHVHSCWGEGNPCLTSLDQRCWRHPARWGTWGRHTFLTSPPSPFLTSLHTGTLGLTQTYPYSKFSRTFSWQRYTPW